MNNLFIMHTQYNLILSAGITTRYKNDYNVLVLYAEFSVYDQLLARLNDVFDEVVVVNDSFKRFNSSKGELDFIKQCAKKCKKLWHIQFDKVFLSQESIFERILLRKAQKLNKNVVSFNIEEDAYYSINNKFNDENYKAIVPLKTKVKRFLQRCYLFGYPYNYKEIIYCYGMYSEHVGVHMLFPDIARREIRNKNNTEITKEELLFGINALYGYKKIDYPKGDKYLIIFFDLLSRYQNKQATVDAFKQLVEQYNDYTILLKYHPRETQKIQEFSEFYEVDNTVPAEKALLDLVGKDVVVVGNATTSILVAAKMEYKVYSVCNIDAPDNKKMKQAMTAMGIDFIEKVKI